jgi:rhomboid protease GluP
MSLPPAGPDLPPESPLPPTNEPTPAPQPQGFTVRLPIIKPYVTYSIIIACVIVYALQLLSDSLLGFDLPAALGMKINQSIINGQYWRLITPVLLHGSLLHIAFNMYAFYSIGPALERYYGHKRFLMLYLTAGIAGNVASFYFSQAASLGASTAIFGLVTAEGIYIYRNRFMFGREAQGMLINVATIVVVNLMLGMSPGIDNWGHLGGLIGGFAFAWTAGPVFKIGGQPPVFDLIDQHNDTRAAWTAAVEVLILFVLVMVRVLAH